jgi:heterodisulfide reductase subunit D
VTRIPDVEGSDLVPRDPDVLSIGDRDAAEAAVRELADGYEDRAWGCMTSRHKFCREPCPVYQVTRNEQHTSYGFHATVAAMSRGLVELEDAYEQYAFCTQCGACELRCPNTLFTGDFYRNRTQLVQLVKAVRAAGVKAGIERRSWKQWNDDTVAYRNEMQGDPAAVAGWADDLDLPRGGETILFCDCMAAYRQTRVPQAVSLLLREAGVGFGLMNDQWCCGGPALEMGYVDVYEEFARHNLEDWRNAGARRVVTLDPHDYITFVEEYPRLFADFDIEVLHITDLLAEQVEAGRLRLERPLEVSLTYHDPCRLNKRRGIWESPRKLLRAIPGLDFRDVDHVTQWAMCSGAGGGVPVALPKVAEQVARNRLEAVRPLGVDVLASACVWAEDHLAQVARADGALPVVDVTVLVAMSAGLLDAEPWLAEVRRRRATSGDGGSPPAHDEQAAEEAGP